MCFAGRDEISGNAEMHPNIASHKPASSAPCQISRLLDLFETEKASIKRPPLVFTPCRDRQLDVIQTENGHG